MNRRLCITFLFGLSLVFIGCKKNKTPETPEPEAAPVQSTPLFINFMLDCAAKSFTGTQQSIHTGFAGGANCSSGFFSFTSNISINLSMPLDSISETEFQSLVGQKIAIGNCGGCPTNANLDVTLDGNDYISSDANNTLPNEYIKFNSVNYHSTVTVFDESVKQYYVTGEFNLKLNYGSDVKTASNGSFGLLFRELKKS